MRKPAESKTSYFLSKKGKKVLKISLILSVVVLGAGFFLYAYLSYAGKLTYEKYLEGKDFYLKAQAEEDKQQEKSDLKKAAELFEEIISRKFFSGNKQEVFVYLADCFYRLGESDKSINLIKDFLKRYPKSYFSPWMRLKIASIYEEKGNYEEAIKYYQIIRERYAQTSVAPEAVLGEARCCEALGRKEAALKLYQNLISRYPLSSQAKIAEAKLQNFARTNEG